MIATKMKGNGLTQNIIMKNIIKKAYLQAWFLPNAWHLSIAQKFYYGTLSYFSQLQISEDVRDAMALRFGVESCHMLYQQTSDSLRL
jgi:hypothetical protein